VATARQRAAPERGLPSLNEARAERRRALVHGKYKLRGQLAPRFWLWTAVILSGFGVIYWKIWQGKLLSQKSAVMAKQRAVAQALSPQVVPFRDKIEGWVQQLAGPPKPDRVAPGLSPDKLNSAPGVYLRLRLENATSVDSIREASAASLLDGFTSCLFVNKGASNPAQGPPCNSSADCAPGLLCNEYNVCLPPPKPYNMRLAYRALRVLSSDWTDELHEATSELQVKAFERDLERASEDDVPIAIRLLARATFFTLVMDEDPASGLPEALEDSESEEERVQRVAHAARIGVWNLKTGQQLLRLRAVAGGRLVPAGAKRVHDRKIMAAQQRQANSCALALAVKQALEGQPPKPGTEPDPPSANAGRDARLPDAAAAPAAASASGLPAQSPP
jgi:hypothetical protein